MKRIITVCVLLVLLSGCRKVCCTNYSVHIFLKYQDSNNADLLDSRTPNALTEQDIEVYVLRKGERIRIFNSMRDAQKNFKIRGSSTGGYFMQFYFDIAKESFAGKKVTMFITYKGGSEDKLVGEFDNNTGNNINLMNVWINDIPVEARSNAFIIKK